VSPMKGLEQPSVVETPPDVLDADQVMALLKACEGRGFTDRRDAAIIRLMLIAGGPRLGEVAALQVDDVDLEHNVVHVIGKGRRPRTMPFSDKTAMVLGRYLRAAVTTTCTGRRGCGSARRAPDRVGDHAGAAPASSSRRHQAPAPAHAPPHGGAPVEGRRRQRRRRDAPVRVAVDGDGQPLRREARGRARPGCCAASGSMTTSDGGRCRKIRYRDRVAALLALASTGRNKHASRAKEERQAYRCKECNGWHLTSRPPRR
jgi:hypothetical protein